MTLAQVQGAVALVVALILSWAGLLMATALSLPVQTDKARQALEARPRRCFLHGTGLDRGPHHRHIGASSAHPARKARSRADSAGIGRSPGSGRCRPGPSDGTAYGRDVRREDLVWNACAGRTAFRRGGPCFPLIGW